MTTHVLAIERVGVDQSVVVVASALASVLHAGVRVMELPTSHHDEDVHRALLALAEPDVAAGVLADGDIAAALCWRVARAATKPIALVPRRATPERTVIGRVLLPLDGTPESAAAVAPTMELFASTGADLVVLHVFERSNVPKFWDQATHAQRAWESEFLSRHCPHGGVRMELRTGLPGQNILDVAVDERVDLITLGWSQQVDPGRARTVRRIVADADVPVLLLPIADG